MTSSDAGGDPEVRERRARLVEQVADVDERIMEMFVEGAAVPAAELKAAVRRATLAGKAVPVLHGASFRNKGVQPLLDAVLDYLPAPTDVPPMRGLHPKTHQPEIRQASDDEPFAALVFKVQNDPYMGNLAYFRVYSGKAHAGSTLYNPARDEEERVARFLEMHSNKRTEVKDVFAGDIMAMGTMKGLATGDTLCAKARPLILETITFPEPVIQMIVEPKAKVDHGKLESALAKLAKEDPTLRLTTDANTGQALLHGMGELHLDIIIDRLAREFGVRANTGRPQVAYKESLRKAADRPGRVRPPDGRQGPLRQGRAVAGAPAPRRRLRLPEQGPRDGSAGRVRRPRSRTGSGSRWTPACWPATRSRTSGPPWPRAPGARPTRARWPSRSPRPRPSRTRPSRPIRRSWSR